MRITVTEFMTGSGLGASNRDDSSAHVGGITVNKSVEFTYEELANATDNFSIANKIGEGGFGAVYYAELRGEVRLIGYCTEGSLFLVYEYVENGNLSQHLGDTGKSL